MGVRYGASGRGAGAVLKDKNTYKPLSVNRGTPLLSDGSVTANNKGKQMETSTGELIAKLTNISHNLALELRFKEASVIMEAVGALHALPNIAETIRDAWHPSLNSSGPSKGITYISNVTVGKSDEIKRLQKLADNLYEETKRCGSLHDTSATNEYEEWLEENE
jgi:hypothetical protein